MIGNIIYGMGEQQLGSLGTIVGWPIYLVSMVFSSNMAAIWTGNNCYSYKQLIISTLRTGVIFFK